MSRRWMALLAWVLVVPAGWAQAPPPTDPASVVQHHPLAYDRSAVPPTIELLAPRTLLGYNADPARGYGRIHLTCRSDSDSGNGRCPTRDTGANGAGSTDIALRFTERRSGLRTDITATGSLQRAFVDRRCALDHWNSVQRPLGTSFGPSCIDLPPGGTGATLSIPAAELSKLVAGRWDARLLLDLRSDSNGTPLATYEFQVELTVSDRDAVAIYFPAFDLVEPHVGLNLQYDPISRTVGGRAALDMCLYDGLGSQSEFLGVTLRDTRAGPSAGDGYAVWHHEGGSDPARRVDYTVTLDHGGARLPMANGVEQLLAGIDSARLRLVVLPGMTQPVYCVPTPLSLETPRVPISSKRPGYYEGELQVELRVPTFRP